MGNFRYSETGVAELLELGRLIRAKRRAIGLRIDDAAALCGVSVDLLSRLENGSSGVSTGRVLKVLDGLGLAMLVVDKTKLRKTVAAANSTDPDPAGR
jgi:transcriptional regulator with XRE-family HTH domain